MMKRFDPLNFLEVAHYLAYKTKNQPRLRTAIGRAYYAMFLLARDRMNIRDKVGVHDKVLEALEDRGEHWLASRLGQLKRLREAADYQTVAEVRAYQNWQKSWEEAQKIVQDIRPRLEAMYISRSSRPPHEG